MLIVPDDIALDAPLHNPGLPEDSTQTQHNSRQLSSRSRPHSLTVGSGLKRIYLDMQSLPPDVAYPPRPKPGSIADLDIIMEHCDFSNNKVCTIVSDELSAVPDLIFLPVC